jgi:1,4-dihydroxy-2-naphthoate octaprenyltransferase
MGRFPLLLGGLLYYLLGALMAAFAGHPLSAARLLLGYAILAPAHLSVHLSNDYFDLDGDRLGEATSIYGGSGILIKEPELRPLARSIAILLVGLSGVMGVWAYLTVLPTLFLPVMLVLGNGIGWFYSAPPVRLSSRGLGEAATAIAIGLLIPGMGYLATADELDLTFLLASIPLLLFGVSFILSVEIPDRGADAASGKRTFIVRHGVPKGLRLILGSTLTATLLYITAPFTALLPPAAPPIIIAPISLIPLIPPLAANLRVPQGQGDLGAFARRNVLSLIAFGALADACLLLTLVSG